MKTSASQQLTRHQGIIRALRMVDLFDADPQRAQRFSLELDSLYLDYSKNRISDETMRLLSAWGEEQKLPAAIKALFSGQPLNTTEKRPALHTVLRQQHNQPCVVNGVDVVPEVRKVQAQMRDLVAAVEQEGKYKYLINIGVGGSDLGPKMATRALTSQARNQRLQSYFLSNIDAHVMEDVLSICEPAQTLVIITSKTFTTLETMHNADLVRAWLVKALGEQAAQQQLVAVTASPEKAADYGVTEARIFPFWDWVGGRYSLWSAVGLSIALTVGWSAFERLLQGAAAMDEHFATAPLAENMPVILGLLGCWYRNWFDYGSHCVVPYDERMKYLVAYMQQLDMESNGKTVGRSGTPALGKTGPVIWGRPGTNSQHAFFQWLHQGRDIAPVDFIVAKKPSHDYQQTHQLLAANAIAQAEALLTGKQAPTGQPYRQFDGNRPSNFILLEQLDAYSLGMLIALYEHKIFVQGWMWGLNSFDQWGVELGKALAKTVEYELRSGQASSGHDCSTETLIAKLSD